MPDPRTYTTSQLAAALGVHRATVHRWVVTGRVRARRYGTGTSAWRISADAARLLLREVKTTPRGAKVMARSARRRRAYEREAMGAQGYSTSLAPPHGIPDADSPDSG